MMTLTNLKKIFNRALLGCFSRSKWLFVFTVLALCGLLLVFFRALAGDTNQWMLLSSTFLPIFLSSGVLLATGIILIRLYHDEIKQKPASFRTVVSKSWEVLIGASYFCIPVLLTYLVLWVLLGVFVLLETVPYFGNFFGIVLAFAPFLINLCTLLLCVLNVAILFYVTPIVALKGMNRQMVSHTLAKKFQTDPFTNIALALIALLPILCFIGLLVLAVVLTGAICPECKELHHKVLQWVFIMLPFTALLAPAVVFFFNFAAESHVLIQKQTN